MKTTNVDVEIVDTNVHTNTSKHKSRVQNIEKKIVGNKYEPEVALEDKVYLEMYYNHQLGNVVVDETTTRIKAQELEIVGWMLMKNQ